VGSRSDFDQKIKKLFERLDKKGDFLAARRSEVLDKEDAGPTSGSTRQLNVTAGPLMSSSADEVLVEEIRRVKFAIQWLVETELVRRDPGGTLLLVHDGSGKALRDFADKAALGFQDHPFRLLTAARGEHYEWAEPPNERLEPPIQGQDACQVVANLNWRECLISQTKFRNIVFLNADFTGSRFDSCTFEGVTFINCLLDDAHFDYCRIISPADLAPVERKTDNTKEKIRLAPSFMVEAPEQTVRDFAAYDEENAPPSSVLFSDTSGTPAKLGQVPAGHGGEVIAHFTTDAQRNGKSGLPRRVPSRGGVIMVGGRLCNLTLYHWSPTRAAPSHFTKSPEADLTLWSMAVEGLTSTTERSAELLSRETRPGARPTRSRPLIS
jgi:hypothetical protein